MNQTPRYIDQLCMVCKQNTVRTLQVYNCHTSDWMTVDPPICLECRMEKLSSALSQAGVSFNEAATSLSESAKRIADLIAAEKTVTNTEEK